MNTSIYRMYVSGQTNLPCSSEQKKSGESYDRPRFLRGDSLQDAEKEREPVSYLVGEKELRVQAERDSKNSPNTVPEHGAQH